MALALAACGPSPPPAKAPAPAAPKATSVVVCGERISTTTDEVRCVGEGVVALEGLRELDRLTKLTLDDQSLPALWKLDDTTLARLRELTIESVPVSGTVSFMMMKAPVVKTAGFARLGGLVSLELRVDLEDPKTLRSLTNLRILKTSTTNLPNAEVVSEMVGLKELNVDEMSDLRPLRKLRSLEVLRGVDGQRGACKLIEQNQGLRELSLSPKALGCPAMAQLPALRSITVALPANREEADGVVIAISKLKKLRGVTLFGAAATLRPLEALPDLVELESHVGALDLQEVAGLRRLERLEWSGPGSAEHLAGMTRLRELRWDHYKSDWTKAPSLPALEVLEVYSLGDVAPLAKSPRLREASLGPVRGDVSVLAGLTELRTLSFEPEADRDLSTLATLTRLEKLDLWWYDGSLEWLEGMANLRELSVTGAAPRLETLPASLSLDRLEVRGEMGPAIELPALRVETLILGPRSLYRPGEDPTRSVQDIESLSGIERVRGLRELVLDSSSVRSLEPLKGHHGLRRIDISGAPITSLEPLRGKPLRNVDISGTRVSDLGPLADANRLMRLMISDTAIDDLRPVARLPALALLDVSSTPMGHLGQLVAMASLYYLNITYTGVRDLSPLADLTSLRYLSAPRSATHFVPLADVPLLAVQAQQFNCASKDAVPFVFWSERPKCMEEADEEEDDIFMSGHDDDPFDQPWGER